MTEPGLVLEAHDRYGLPMAFGDPGDIVVTGGFDGSLATWSIPDGAPVTRVTGHKQSVNCGVLTVHGTVATGSTDETVRTWSVPDLEPGEFFEGHTGTVAGLAAHPSRAIVASGAYDGTVRLWNLENAMEPTVLTEHENNVTTVAFAGERVISGGLGGSAIVWDLESAAIVAELPDHGAAVVGIATTEEHLWTAGYDGHLRAWSPPDWSVTNDIDIGESPTGFAAHPHDDVLAVTVGGSVRKLAADGTELAHHEIGIKGVSTPRWSPDGNWLAVGGADGRVRLYR